MLLLDTNVLSELRKVFHKRTDPAFAAWANKLRWSETYISAVTLYEIESGISQVLPYDPVQASILRNWFDTQVLEKLASHILPVTTPIWLQAARLRYLRTRETEDILLAATAQVHGLTMVTRNLQDFHDVGVPILNPWKPSS